MPDHLRITAYLSSPLAGEAPHLDSLLEYALTPHLIGNGTIPREHVQRSGPCYPEGTVPIPLARQWVAGRCVARCSSPIIAIPTSETVEYYAKRIGVENAGLLAPSERKIVTTTNSWTKSYRLPLRCRRVDRIAWFATGSRREVLRLLTREITAVGKKTSDGYGVVSKWVVDRVDEDWSWFAGIGDGDDVALMRPLPAGDYLPQNLVGYREGFGACSAPYWHQSRYCPLVSPC